MAAIVQSAIRLLYPPQCLLCDQQTGADHALCPSCWATTPFVRGLVCDVCGTPLEGTDDVGTAFCDSCLLAPKPWSRGRSVFLYAGGARRMVLAFKHGDRTDLAAPLSRWIADAARDLIDQTTLIVPVPLHRFRLLGRRYNQSALLAVRLGKKMGKPVAVDALLRQRRTRLQDGLTREQRRENLEGSIVAFRHRARMIAGQNILLIDDVMTSGATLSACTEACYASGAADVNVVVVARVARPK